MQETLRPTNSFKGEMHSSDASGGVALTLYENGALTGYTLQSGEILEVHSVQIVSAPGGDVHLFSGADATPGAGETIVRGTVAATEGITQNLVPPHLCPAGKSIYAVAPAGVLDVIVRGLIIRPVTKTAPVE